METYGPKVRLSRFRRDAVHRGAMCSALGEDEPKYLPLAEVGKLMADIDELFLSAYTGSDAGEDAAEPEDAGKMPEA